MLELFVSQRTPEVLVRKKTLFALAIVFTPSIALAQGTFGPVSISAGLGIEAAHVRDNTTWTPGKTLHATITVQPSGARWGLRLSGWFFDRQRDDPSFWARAQAAGLGLEGRYDILTGQNRLYGFAGAGPSALYLAVNGSELRNSGSPFITGGLGAEHSVGRASLFLEARLIRPLHDQDFGTFLVPVSVGLRF